MRIWLLPYGIHRNSDRAKQYAARAVPFYEKRDHPAIRQASLPTCDLPGKRWSLDIMSSCSSCEFLVIRSGAPVLVSTRQRRAAPRVPDYDRYKQDFTKVLLIFALTHTSLVQNGMRTILLLFGLMLAPSLVNAQTRDSLIIALIDGSTITLDLEEIEVITFESTLSVELPDDHLDRLSIYPNPSTDDVTISFPVDIPQRVKLEIIREDGVVVRTIEQQCDKGASSIRWNGLQDDGSIAPPSTYLFRALVQEKILTGKLTFRR